MLGLGGMGCESRCFSLGSHMRVIGQGTGWGEFNWCIDSMSLRGLFVSVCGSVADCY